MGNAIVTLKIMPSGVDVNHEELGAAIKEKIAEFAGEGDMKVEQKPVAFGLIALEIMFVMDEDKGSTESLENNITEISGVQSVDVIDVRRALG